MDGKTPKRTKQDPQMEYLGLIGEDNRSKTDAVLVADNGTRFPCHSQVLFLHSPVLAGMQDLQQQKDDGTCRYQFPLECKADTVGLMLLEIYRAFQHDKVASSYSGFTAESVKGLVSIAHKLGTNSLLDRSEGWLVENKDNVLSSGPEEASKNMSWMKFACHFQLDKFRKACEDVIARNVRFYAKNARAELEELTPKVLISIAVKTEQSKEAKLRALRAEVAGLEAEVAELRPQDHQHHNHQYGYGY